MKKMMIAAVLFVGRDHQRRRPRYQSSMPMTTAKRMQEM